MSEQVNVMALMQQRKTYAEALSVLADRTKIVKEAIEAIESELKAHMVHTQQQSIKVKGLYNASIVEKTYYAAEQGVDIKGWAIENDPSLLTISLKQSGVKDYAADHEGALPPGIKASVVREIKLTAAK